MVGAVAIGAETVDLLANDFLDMTGKGCNRSTVYKYQFWELWQ